MKIPEVTFIDSGPASTLEQLSCEMNGMVKNDTLILDNDIWKGYIKQIEPETGLYLQVWNCSLLVPLVLKHSCPGHSVQPACNVLYTLTPGIFSIKQENSLQNFSISPRANTFFTTNFTKAEFELVPHDNLRSLFISITTDWVLKQFQHSETITEEFIPALNTKQAPIFIFETASNSEYLLISEIFDHIKTRQADDFFIHSRLLLLISYLFDKLFIHKQNDPDNNSTLYFDKLKKAEQVIGSHLRGKLPSISEISDIIEMNEASLKRYFKLLFGKTIYEYYLHKKMDLAKRMLVEKNLNVNEVAMQLGYEKTTNFIDIFKKHFGYLPGTIRKNH